MSDLGDLLELLHGSTSSWQSAHLVVCTQWDPDWAAQTGARILRKSVKSYLDSREEERRTHAWERSPTGLSPYTRKWEAWITEAKQREDITDEWWHHILRWAGEQTCIEGPNPTYFGNQRGQDESGIPWHQLASRAVLDPAPLLGIVALTVTGRTTSIGRKAILARGEPRRHHFRSPSDAWWFYCEYILVTVDAERGVLLKTESFVDNKVVTSTFVETIEFDEAVPESLFQFPEKDERHGYPPVKDWWYR